MFTHPVALSGVTSSLPDAGQPNLKSLGLRGGAGVVGAGTGIGLIFKGVIKSVNRQRESRAAHRVDPMARIRADGGCLLLWPSGRTDRLRSQSSRGPDRGH
jgi:F0F1-type ATP synthase membrane subunit c/vacuolar-type H+-ATPase subunit K